MQNLITSNTPKMWLKVDRGELKFRTPLEKRTRQAGWNVFSAKPLRVVTDWIVCIVSCTWGTTWTFCLGNKWKSLARPSGSLWSSLWKDLSSLVPSTGNQLFSSSLPVGAKKAGAWEPTVYTTSQLCTQWHTLETAGVGFVASQKSANAMS